MSEKIQDKIAAHLVANGLHKDGEINSYVISFVAVVFCLLIHVYLLCVFAVYQLTLFVAVNSCSVVLYGLLFYLHRRRRYTWIGLITTIEVTLYTTFFIIVVGIDTYIASYYLLACIMQVTLPYGTSHMRSIALGSITVVSFAMIIVGMNTTPMVVLPAALSDLLTISNLAILFIGTMVQLYIGGLIKAIIAWINELKLAEMSLLANTDTLTGLYNRRYAEMLFRKIAGDGTRNYCVAMLDIDDFKRINDTWGHPCGDEVLIILAQFIRDNLRKTDVVFRWGGEEFLLLLSDVDVSTAFVILDKLREKLADSSIHTTQADLRITVTIGVAVFRPEDVDASIKQSDDYLYIGKKQGKNVVVI